LRIEAVERRLKRDHIAFLRRTWNERIDGPFDDTWFR
jgi:hypothetical protein